MTLLNNKIAILTSGHSPFDERILHKFGGTFQRYGFDVVIICSTCSIDKELNGIRLTGFNGEEISKSQKLDMFVSHLSDCNPSAIICCEPLPIVAAYRYTRQSKREIKIVADITEWYPENYAFKFKGLKRFTEYIKLFLFNFYAVNLADRLIIGEVTKLKRYRIIAPFKKKEIIGYYPILEYFNYSEPPYDGRVFTLCFSGLINIDRGILEVLSASEKAANKYPDIEIKLKVFGKFQYESEKKVILEKIKELKKLRVEMSDWVSYEEISSVLKEADVCIDLRKPNFIYRNSLPIKIFEFMACGKPVIYTKIIPIQKELNMEEIGFFADPADGNSVVEAMSLYIERKGLLKSHSLRARQLAENKFNWHTQEDKLVAFIEE